MERQGRVVAIGFADPDSAIAVRVLSRDPDVVPDAGWVRERVGRAAALRATEPSLSGCDAYRVVHGENDFAPGLVIDRYGDYGVVQLDGAGARAFWGAHRDVIAEAAGLRLDPPPQIVVTEHEARFDVDLVRGQKTGLFLDQRDNRMRVRAAAAGQTVLNLFCYTGGFSIHAALGGASAVTSVDSAAPAIEALRANLTLNDLDPGAHELVAGDAFAFMTTAVSRQRRWDVVIVDPPSFARSEKARGKALGAYRKLNRLAAKLVEPGGLLVSASCSSHVHADDMCAVVADACARTDRRGRIVEVTGAGVDHPVAAGFPEGRYLDCVWTRLE